MLTMRESGERDCLMAKAGYTSMMVLCIRGYSAKV